MSDAGFEIVTKVHDGVNVIAVTYFSLTLDVLTVAVARAEADIDRCMGQPEDFAKKEGKVSPFLMVINIGPGAQKPSAPEILKMDPVFEPLIAMVSAFKLYRYIVMMGTPDLLGMVANFAAVIKSHRRLTVATVKQDDWDGAVAVVRSNTAA